LHGISSKWCKIQVIVTRVPADLKGDFQSLPHAVPLTPKQTLAKIEFLIQKRMLEADDELRAKFTPQEFEGYIRRNVIREELETLHRKEVTAKQAIKTVTKTYKGLAGSPPLKKLLWEDEAEEKMAKEHWGIVAISRFRVWRALKAKAMKLRQSKLLSEERNWWRRRVTKNQRTENCTPIFVIPAQNRNWIAMRVNITASQVDTRVRELVALKALIKMGLIEESGNNVYMLGYFDPEYAKAIYTVNAKNWKQFFCKKQTSKF
jgi:hypothetical protein